MDAQQLSDELNLKTITALSNVVADEERGIISPAEAKTACRAIFDMAGGLVPTATFDLISQVAEKYKGAKATEVQWVRVGDRIMGVARVLGGGAVLRIEHATPQRKPDYDIDTDSKARDEARAIFGALKQKVQPQW